MLSRAPAPKAGAYANFTTPARPGDRTAPLAGDLSVAPPSWSRGRTCSSRKPRRISSAAYSSTATGAALSRMTGACAASAHHFSDRSDDILGLFTRALDDLGIPWTRSSEKIASVHRKAATARLDEFVGPKC